MKNLFYTIIFLLSIFSCSNDDDAPRDPLIINYEFNGNLINSAASGNDGSPKGGVTFVEDRKGNPMSAVLFDGIDDRISFNNPFTNSNIEAYSISGWFMVGDNFDGNQVVVLRDKTITNILISKVTNETSDVCFDNFIDSEWKMNCFEVNTENWIHIVGIYQRNKGSKLYINGDLVNEINFTGNMSSDNSIGSHLGAIIREQATGDPDTFWHGIIDDLRVYSKALSQSEISTLYLD